LCFSGGLGAGDDAVVVVLVERDTREEQSGPVRFLAAGFGHCFEAMLSLSREIAAVDMDSVSLRGRGGHVAVLDKLGDTGDAGGDGGDAAGHPSSAARPNDSISLGMSIRSASGRSSFDVGPAADEVDAVPARCFRGEIFGDAAVGAVADEHQACRHGFGTRAKTVTTS